MPKGLSENRLNERVSLLKQFDHMKAGLDQDGSMDALNTYQQQAVDLLLGERARQAFDLKQEDAETRERYGKHLWCQQALIARRLVEAGTTFVTLDLSYHGASGTWDNHGDNIPPYGGISKGLGPLLPLFDHLITTLVSDLEARGLLDKVMVIAMGEFGRTPRISHVASSGGGVGSGAAGVVQPGRDHWPQAGSFLFAGGGIRTGQVIGATDKKGEEPVDRRVGPEDFLATIYAHLGIDYKEATIRDFSGRPTPIIRKGEAIKELEAQG